MRLEHPEQSKPKGQFFFTYHDMALQKSEQPKMDEAKIEKLPKKKDISLGDLNPLIRPVDFGNRSVIDTNIEVIHDLIDEFGGVQPIFMDYVPVFSPRSKSTVSRFVARFIVDDLPENKIALLEQLVKDTYKVPVRTRIGKDGSEINPNEKYPPLNEGDKAFQNTNGWYFGSGDIPTDSGNLGLYVYRDSGEVTRDNFSKKQDKDNSRFIIEVREGSLYQTDQAEFITQVSTILSKGERKPYGQLLHKIYYDLFRYGMKLTDNIQMHGMDENYHEINRRLIKPVANPELSDGLHHQPESVLLIGVPGTGKTLLAKQFLHAGTGVFMVPVTPQMLYSEMKLPPEKQTLLPRIDEVSGITGKKIILHVDDIEEIAKSEQGQANFQNLMAGVRDRGFHLLASTNEPEVMEEALLQPQRLAVLLYCGLHNEPARYEIMKIHAPKFTKKRKMPLWPSDAVRDLTLNEIATHTTDVTPRYQAQIGTVAKSYLLNRVSETLGKQYGMTEEDLREGDTFSWQDWENALRDVLSRYDFKSVRERDEFLRNFVNKANRQFEHIGSKANSDIVFSKEFHQKLAGINSNGQQTQQTT